MITKSLAGEHNLVYQPSVKHALQMTLAAILAADLAIAAFAVMVDWQLVWWLINSFTLH